MTMDSNDTSRVSALKGYGVLDTPNEAAFDDIVVQAARILRTPIALISLIDENRQWFKGQGRAGAVGNAAGNFILYTRHPRSGCLRS